MILIPLFPQEDSIDYNKFYYYPFSIGIEFQSLSALSNYAKDFNIIELCGNLRLPVPNTPFIQPSLQFGIIQFDSINQDDPSKYVHTHWYGSLGFLFVHRFSKDFEIGIEILGGGTEAIFPHLLPEYGTVGSPNIFFETGFRMALNPFFNLNIDIHPNIKYMVSLSSLKDYDGFIFGIGFTAHFRLGDDPDSKTTILRSIKFSDISLPNVFAAMQSYYIKNPLGKITIINTEKHKISDIEVMFFQPGFMDSPTPSASISELGPEETSEIDIFASFNNEIFNTEGITPLTGEIIVTYKSYSKPGEQRQSFTYDLYDKTAIVWNDDNKVAAYLTPADSALRNYASFIRQSCKDKVILDYNKELQYAIQVFHALSTIGCIYQADPTSPFTTVKGNKVVIDSISLLRDTLKRITGDCDDLTIPSSPNLIGSFDPIGRVVNDS